MSEAAAPLMAATDIPPEIAVIIPVHSRPGPLPEAVGSVLAQRGPRRIAVVIVDDGCPHPETRETALRIARHAPGRVHVLRRRHGGPGAARNTGIAFALTAWPDLRAILPLDAEDRLSPDFLPRAADLLESSGAGWVYPDDSDRPAYPAASRGYSLLLHLLTDLLPTAGLIARPVLDAGLRYDEAMRAGLEGWDFWLRAAAAGFRGRPLPMAGARRDPAGVHPNGERQCAATLAAMRARLAPLIRPRPLLALEAAEVPRFLFLRTGFPDAASVVDPLRPRQPLVTREAARRRLVEAHRRPAAVHAPAFAVLASDAAIAVLTRAKIFHHALWQATRLLRGADAVTVTLAPGEGDAVALGRAAGRPDEAALIVLRSAAMAEAATAARTDWPDAARTTNLRVVLPIREFVRPVLPDLVAELAALTRTFATRHPGTVEERDDRRSPRAHEACGELLGLGATLPWLAPPEGRDIAIILPAFGPDGAGRLARGYAHVLRTRGWRPHLVLAGTGTADLSPEALDLFDTIHFPPAPVPGDAPTGEGRDIRDLAGLIAPMHAVLAMDAPAVHAVMPTLRAAGVATFAALLAEGPDAAGLPDAGPHVLLPHEPAYDGIVVASRALRDRCLALGMPAAKLITVPGGDLVSAADWADRRAPWLDRLEGIPAA